MEERNTLDQFLDKFPRVTSPEIFKIVDGEKIFHPEGLFSEQIFGPRHNLKCQCGKLEGSSFIGQRCDVCGVECTFSSTRKVRFAVIELPFRIPQVPILFNTTYYISRLNSVDENLDYTRYLISKFLKKEYSEVTDEEYFNYSTKFIVVIPPESRPYLSDEGIMDDLNNKYKLVLVKLKNYENEQLKKEIQKGIITSDLFKTIKNKISGKDSFIRRYLLGKRIPGGRTVVTPDPYLPSDTVRIPLRIAVKLFGALIIHHLSSEHSASYVHNEIEKISHGQPSHIKDVIKETLELISEDYKVLINRQPTLHTSNIQAYKFKITETDTLQVNDIIAPPFNLDHDGDSFLGKVLIYDKKGNILFEGEVEELEEVLK